MKKKHNIKLEVTYLSEEGKKKFEEVAKGEFKGQGFNGSMREYFRYIKTESTVE